jgi:hypothetical protein
MQICGLQVEVSYCVLKDVEQKIFKFTVMQQESHECKHLSLGVPGHS